MKNILKNKHSKSTAMTYLVVTVAFIIMQTLSSLGMLKSSVNGYLVPVCAYIVLAVSLNLLVGVCGELSLGHAGFMGIGAFTGIVISALLKSYIASDILRLAIAMVGGGIMASIPTRMGIGIFSPSLDGKGNSIAGIQVLKRLSRRMYLSIF